jgi:uncharacterized damage-inducible protein DinB
MDRVAEMQELWAFNRWANRRLLDAAAKLTQEQYTKDLGSSFPSLRDTLAHIASSEWVWLSRWQGTSPRERPEKFSTTSLDELRHHWIEVEQSQRAFLSELSDERLDNVMPYTTMAGEPQSTPLWQMMRHVINHSTYHRGQAATLLRQLGATPPTTDLIAFYRAPSDVL